MRFYEIQIPDDIDNELEVFALKNHISVQDILEKFVLIGIKSYRLVKLLR